MNRLFPSPMQPETHSNTGAPQMPKPLKYAFNGSCAFLIAMPFLRSVVPMKSMPKVAFAAWGATFAAGLIWKQRFHAELPESESHRNKF